MTGFLERARRGITRCVDADLPELDEFQRRSYGESVDDLAISDQDWLFVANPNRSLDGIGIWIARRNDRIVGQQAEMSFGLRVEDDEFRAAAAVTLMVEPEWRLRGVGVALSEVVRHDARVVCALGITSDALRMYRSAGWVELGSIQRYVAPLRASAVRRATSAKAAGARQLAVTVSGKLVAFAARVRALRTKLELVERFDERADAIWASAKRFYPVLATRTLRDLSWRFDEGPHARLYRRYYLVHRGHAIGYVVLRSKPRDNVGALRIVDYLVAPDALGALLAHCIVLAQRERCAVVELITRNPSGRRRIRSLGFLPTSSEYEREFMVSVESDDPLHDRVTDPESWFVTCGDSDLEFIDAPRDGAGQA